MSNPPLIDADTLVQQYLDLGEQIADLVSRQDSIKAQLRDRFEVGKHETGNGTVTLSVNRRFDEATARTVLTADEIAAATEPRLSSALVKKLVSPLRYEACSKVAGEPRVTVSA